MIIWMVKLFEYTLNTSYADFGVLPRTLEGLKGILFMPFLHGDVEHLISNSVPILILGIAIIYFYRGIGYKVIAIIWFMSGLLTWAFAIQDGRYHIGASALVYGFAAFLFVSGTIRKDRNLLAIALAVVSVLVLAFTSLAILAFALGLAKLILAIVLATFLVFRSKL